MICIPSISERDPYRLEFRVTRGEYTEGFGTQYVEVRRLTCHVVYMPMLSEHDAWRLGGRVMRGEVIFVSRYRFIYICLFVDTGLVDGSARVYYFRGAVSRSHRVAAGAA